MRKRKPARHTNHHTTKGVARSLYVFALGSIAVISVVALLAYISYTRIMDSILQSTEVTTVVLVPESLEMADQRIVLLTITGKKEESSALVLAGSELVSLPGGYGEYRLAAIAPLLTLDGKDAQYTAAVFSHVLGTVVEQVYPVPTLSMSEPGLQTAITEFGWREWISTRKVPHTTLRVRAFLERGIQQQTETTLAELPTTFLEQNTVPLEAQNCPISILNATTITGAAFKMSTLLEQSGFITIRTGSYPSIENETTLYYANSSECQEILRDVATAFFLQPRLIIDEEKTMLYRAPIVVVIGEDYQ